MPRWTPSRAGVCHADMPQGDPRLVRCPVCFSKPGEPCTQPTENGQRPVAWFHLMREDDARAEANGLGGER